MNEELMIKIKASVDDALKKIEEVNKKIEDMGNKSKKSSKTMADSMKSAVRAAQLQVEAIKQVISSLVNLGKSSIEAQKNISKLNAAFLAAGSTTAQAGETYKNLYRFMGDNGAATEAAQQLALITNNEKDLLEWTKLLQGVYATMGSTLPIESLAEAANETIKVGKVTGTMADALNWAGASEDAFNEKLAKTNSLSEREALVRSTLNNLYINAANIYERNNQALLANAESQARLDMALAEAGKVLLPLMTAINNLAATLLTVLRPAFEVVAAVVTVFVDYIMVAITWISAFFSLFTSKGSVANKTTKGIAEDVKKIGTGAKFSSGGVNGLTGALNGASKAAKELKKQTMGFDELNVVSSQDSASSGAAAGGGAGGGGIPMPDLSGLKDFEIPGVEEFEKNLDIVKEKIQGILVLIGLVGAALLGAWLYLEFYPGSMDKLLAKLKLSNEELALLKQKMANITGTLMIIAGAFLLVQGYSDAWANGIDWGNLAAMIAGVALVVGGIALSFGALYAGAAAIGAGIALVVLGIKDFIENGYSMQNVLTILAGVIAIVVGVCLAFNAALLANPITWIIIAIAALVAAFVILWNECDGFRNFLIGLWETISSGFSIAWAAVSKFFTETIPELFKNVMAWLKKHVVEPIANFYNKWIKPIVDKLIEIVKKLVEMIVALFVGLWNLLKEKVIDPIVEGFKFVWEKVSGFFTSLWEDIKEVWEKIKQVFAPVVSWFTDIFSKAWQAVKNVFSNFTSFFSGLWDKIKNTFSKLGASIGDAIGGAVKAGINSVIGWIEKTINKAIGLINGAINLINKLPGVSVGKLTELKLPRLAKGGIVDSATYAMIGEAGKEAVLPLENNTGWMDKLADRLAAKTANPTKVILKVGEKELGWATIGAINGITEQTGGLQLVL